MIQYPPLYHHCITRKITLRDNALLLNRSTVNFDERVLPVRRWRVTTAIPLCWCDNVDGRADVITTLSKLIPERGYESSFVFVFCYKFYNKRFLPCRTSSVHQHIDVFRLLLDLFSDSF